MVKPEIDIRQIRKAIRQLPERQRIKLTRDLVRDHQKGLWKKILRDIDKRVEKFPISQKEIDQEIEACRKHTS